MSVKGGEITGCSCVVVESPDPGRVGVEPGAPPADDPGGSPTP